MKVKNIKRSVKKLPTFDIEVGGIDGTHSYVLPNGCVSHNSTNGVEPVRNLITVKKNRDKRLPIVVPSFQKLKNKYELLWDIESNKGYLDILAVIQKFTDQAISVNLSYNPNHYEGNEIPMSVLMEDMLYSYALGHKTRYYINTNDEVTEFREMEVDEKVITNDSANDEAEDEDYCESCVL